MLGGIEDRIKVVAVERMRPNTWNPNRMNDNQFKAAYHSIRLHGFRTPIIVREIGEKITPDQAKEIMGRIGRRAGSLMVTEKNLLNAKLEIIDGEHRWVAVQALATDIGRKKLAVVENAVYTEHGWTKPGGEPLKYGEIARGALGTFVNRRGRVVLPTINLGEVGDIEAKRLTIVLNETRGSADISELATIIRDIEQHVGDLEQATVDLPFTDEQLEQILTATPNGFDIDEYIKQLESSEKKHGELRIVMSKEAAEVWERTFERVAELRGLPDTPAARKAVIVELAKRMIGQ